MFSELPVLVTQGQTPEDKVAEIENYLYMLREALEMELSNIGTDNLSDGLIKKLEGLGVDISLQEKKTQDYIQQISQRTLSVRDVVSSPLFLTAVEDALTSEGTINAFVNSSGFLGKIESLKGELPQAIMDYVPFQEMIVALADKITQDVIDRLGGR